MADAANRDTAAWDLAESVLPLVRAFEKYRLVDQYGGLLFFSALFYRYFGGGMHQPLQIVVLTASFSALAVLFTWAFVQRAWGERPVKIAAWIVAIFPEAVLLGSTQMREAFTMTLVAACAYGLVRFHQERAWGGLAWVMVGLAMSLLFSPPFAGLVLGMLIVLALSMDGWHVLRQPRLWLSIASVIAIILSLLLTTFLRYFTRKYVVNPIEELNRTAERIADGTYKGEVQVDEESAYAALQGLLRSGQKVLSRMDEHIQD